MTLLSFNEAGEQEHLDAVLALLNAGTNQATRRAYDLDELAERAKRPKQYTEVTVFEAITDNARGDGETGVRRFVVLTRAVALNAQNAREMRRLDRAALDGRTVTVAGRTSTPLRKAVQDDPIGPDDGWFSGLSEWIYAI